MVFKKIKKALLSNPLNETSDEYIEIDLETERKENKVLVKLFSLRKYEEVTDILNALREGHVIAIIDIKLLRKKDPIELKRAVAKIKKTVNALEGSIAGFGENTIIATPSFAKIEKHVPSVSEEKKESEY